MPKKNPALLHKVTNLLKFSIFLAKLKKSMIRKTRRLKKLKLHNHYSYVKEYEFSASSTPLIEFGRNARSGRLSSFKKTCLNVLFISKCLEMGMETPLECIEGAVGGELVIVDSSNSWTEEDESVDERAERFIQRFYQEMTRQRNDSDFHLLDI